MIGSVASWAFKTINRFYERLAGGAPPDPWGRGFAGVPAPDQGAPAASPATAEAAPPRTLRKLGRDEKYRDTAWVPRLLWALEWARLNRFDGEAKPLTAAELSRILRDQCGLDVPRNNVARAFRNFEKDERAVGLWVVSAEGFAITESGSAALASVLGS